MVRTDWMQIAHCSPGGGYEWDEFAVYWTGDRFAWSQQSGCSCNNFDDDESNFTVGTKSDLLVAIGQWNGGSFGDAADVTRLLEQVNSSGH